MASYLDQPYQFKPYVATQPVEAMVKVGMIKQQQYDEGVEKIRGLLDEATLLPVSRPVDIEYLKNSIDKVTGQIKSLGAADFSNNQLVSSLAGMTKKISRDPNILAGVQSTAKGQKEFEFMEEARKKGELSPANEFNYKKKWSEYMNSTDLGRTFTGSYSPLFDVDKHLKEVFNEMKPSGYTIEELYLTDTDGKLLRDKQGNYIASPIMKKLEVKGRFAEDVRKVLNQALSDPRVANQLQIDGEYNYRNYDTPALIKEVQAQRGVSLGAITDAVANAQLRKNVAATDDEKDKIQATIDELSAYKTKTESLYNEFQKAASTNPDYVRGQFYKDKATLGYVRRFSYETRDENTLANPIWEAEFKIQQEKNKWSQWAQEFRFKKEVHADNMSMELLKLKNNLEIARIRKKKGTGDGDGGGDGEGGLVTEIADESAARDFVAEQQQNLARVGDQAKTATDNYLFQSFFNTPENLDKVKKLENTGKFTREEAVAKVIDDVAKMAGRPPDAYRADLVLQADKVTNSSNLSNKSLVDAQRLHRQASKEFNMALAEDAEIKEATVARVGQDFEKNLSNLDVTPQEVSIYGTKYKLSKDDIIDLARVLRGEESAYGFTISPEVRTAGKAARQRLEGKGLGSVVSAARLQKDNQLSGLSSPINYFTRDILNFPKNFINKFDIFNPDRPIDVDFSQVEKVFDKLGDKAYEQTRKVQGEVIQERSFVDPKVKMPMLTGKAEDIRNQRQNLARLGGGYQKSGNASPDYKNFAENVLKEDYIPEARAVRLPDGSKAVEVILYKDGKREGGLTLQPEEALNVGVDADALFQPQEVTRLKNYINRSPNKSTSSGAPDDKETYLRGDVFYNSMDGEFPLVPANSRLDVRANIAYRNASYYPFLYVRDKATGADKMIYLSGSPDLNQVLTTLKQTVAESTLQAELMIK
jgi:hypothetical protein